MKHPIFTRSVSLLLAVLMVLSLPAAAADAASIQQPDDSAAAQEEAPLSPFNDSQDNVLPADEQQPTDEQQLADKQQPADEQQPTDKQQPADEQQPADGQQPADQQPSVPVYFDGEGSYLAPEKLTVYILARADGQEADGSSAQEDYTGVVAFYDYNMQDEQKMLEHPYFFYYEKGELQKDMLFASTDRYLSLSGAPTQEAGLTPEDEARTVYTAAEVYVAPDAQEHLDYLFAFNQDDADNGLYTGEKDGLAYAAGLTSAVDITGIAQDETTGGSPTLSWTAQADAKEYQIYRREGAEGAWTKIGATEPGVTSYTDTGADKAGVTYYYYIQAVYAAGSSPAEADVVEFTLRAIPQVQAAAAAGGVRLTWTKDESAAGYRVLRKAGGESAWTTVANLTAAESGESAWQDTDAKSDKTYTYAVRAYYGASEDLVSDQAYTANLWSGYAASGSVYYLAAPVMGNVTSSAAGLVLRWSKVDGATGYQVYRKAPGEKKWTNLTAKSGRVSGLTYTDTTAQVGASYYYTIRAAKVSGGKTQLSSYYDFTNDPAKVLTYHGIPAVTLRNGAGLVVSWSKDATATGYRVFRKASGEKSWTIVANIKKNTTIQYTDTAVASGKRYTYAVRAYYGDVSKLADDKNYSTNLWSSYKASAALVYAAPPALGNIYSNTNSMQITWTPVKGAVGYMVYRRTSTGTAKDFKKLTTIKSGSTSSYTDKTVKAGTAYVYVVRAIYKDADGKEYYSGYYTPKTAAVYHATPTIKVTAAVNGIQLTWSVDAKAAGYRIYRKIGGNTETIANITASKLAGAKQGSYFDRNVTNNTKYTYIIRAYYGTKELSKAGFDRENNWSGGATQTVTFLSAPELTGAKMADSGIQISWKKVAGAKCYYVYRRQKTTDAWQRIASISSGTTEVYVDSNKLTTGGTYYYTVRAGSDSNREKATLSSFDRNGLYAAYLPAPEMALVKSSSSGTTIQWKALSGVTGYIVYRKASGGSWERLTTTTSATVCTFKDTAVKNEKISYYYTVKAYKTITVDGKKVNCYGAYDKKGMSFCIQMKGDGWEKKDGKTYYVKDGICLTGWQYLKRNGDTYKYYFDTKEGYLVTNLYSYFGKSYRKLKCRTVTCINRDDNNPSYTTIYLYDKDTDSYCIPAVSVRCIGSNSKTIYAKGSSSAFMRAGTGQRWLDSGSYEQYATYISGTYSWYHSMLYFGSKSPYSFSSASYNSMINNNNNSGGCIRMQCIYAYLIQDIMKNGYGKDHSVPMVLKKNTSNPGPFGVAKVDKISSRNTDPTDPAITGKFFYDTSIWGIDAKSGAKAWTYY